MGIGTIPSYKLHVVDPAGTGYVARIQNSTLANGDVLWLQAGPTSNPTATTDWVIFADGDGSVVGTIAGNGSGGTDYNTTSDRRLKQNIRDFTGALDMLSSISPKKYEFISAPNKTGIGFIAQDLYEHYPIAVSGTPDQDMELEGPMMIDYSKLTPLLAGGVKELHQLIKEQQIQINELKKQLEELIAKPAQE